MPLRPRFSSSIVQGGEGEGLRAIRYGTAGVDGGVAITDSAVGDTGLAGGGGDFRRPRGSGEMVRAGDGDTGLR